MSTEPVRTTIPDKYDRSHWQDSGPWVNEPDRVEWSRAGLPCLMLRNRSGAWCGYVAVPPGHPLHGLAYGDESPVLGAMLEARKGKPLGSEPGMGVMLAVLTGNARATPELAFEVHGGITFARASGGSWTHPEAAPDAWWFGFDCAHSGDADPLGRYDFGGFYRNEAYAMRETQNLADQIVSVTP